MGGLCYNSPAALCENISLFLWGGGRLELKPDVSQWSPALSGRVLQKAKAEWAGCSPLLVLCEDGVPAEDALGAAAGDGQKAASAAKTWDQWS